MDTERDYELIGRFIYGAHRAGFQLTLLMERMGKPLVVSDPGDKMLLAEDAVEAQAMFARLPASAEVKAQFSAQMQSLVVVAERLGRVASLAPEELSECTSATAAALGALPRYRAMIDDLPGGGAPA